MKTFKQFIKEIDHNDGTMGKHVEPPPLGDNRNLRRLFTTNNGLTANWTEYYGGWLVTMSDESGRDAVRLELKKLQVRVPGGTLNGVVTDNLSSFKRARGQGLAFTLYSELVKHGQVLFSSTSQTAGSRHLWEKLVKSGVGEPFVLLTGDSASWWKSRYPDYEHDHPSFLLSANHEVLLDEAYATTLNRLIIVPFEHLGQLKDKALRV